ncbi:PVC-type heme-binding CxxCH protein [Rubinisphaera margarita]|uniref:PVC-type heme-binding CxxCH protein n=1 Tax=Rubinisphaera margarita TaxID=2909586 RepID=UPI001EE876E6|nr:PVC-type heme-binding CxxCH protein [Rubinisphaera margarita]MCG6155532.1 GDSL-type esterase/lipase family protein [Rubinisphaera margarita]
MKSLNILALLTALFLATASAPAAELELKQGDKIVLIGNTLIERMQYFNHFETALHERFPEHELVVRNLGWSADELKLRPRSQDFNDHGHTLEDHQPDVIIAGFGLNESFAGKAGLEKFKNDLRSEIKTWTTTKYNGESAPRVLLFSPIASENLPERNMMIGDRNNENIELYTKAMKEVAEETGVGFLDLYRPSRRLMNASKEPLTFNGVHLTDGGYEKLAPIMIDRIFGKSRTKSNIDREALHAAVAEKSLQHWYDYRAVNGFYIYGGRKKPFGVVNFPAEFEKLRNMVAVRDARIHKIAQGEQVPDKIDDSGTGEFVNVETNITFDLEITSPEASLKTFKLPDGFEANLFASEVDFPDLQNPCKFTFDGKGRLWVCTMPSYPMYLPGEPVDDKILILEDTDGDGKADKQTIFADGLHLPTGFELGDGGAYIAQQPNLIFMKDTDGDDVADEKRIVLHGFDSADSHHSISAFTWGPDGALYFQEGTFHHTQVETPYGPERCVNAGVYRYEPKTEKFETFISYNFANPWGHTFDEWGQNFVADASPGANYFGAAFSGQVDYPDKHGRLKQFLVKQWRPTCGCEFVSSRNFPKEMQGDYLLNNCIGFQGTLEYRMKDEGSGFHADPVEPLLQSSDRNFRPVDLQFGPDGALYVLDWFNPLVGHMQHSVRDPNRDSQHGRVWRIRHKSKPLVTPMVVSGKPVPELLENLDTYEQRDRYRIRRELRNHKTEEVIAHVNNWLKGLDPNAESFARLQLEGLWIHQQHDVVDESLLKQVLQSKDPRARAAATRVLSYWRDRVENPLALLEASVNDEHPRVRLEAVRALSYFHGDDILPALELAAESLIHEQDDYLEYTLNETMGTLDKRLNAGN